VKRRGWNNEACIPQSLANRNDGTVTVSTSSAKSNRTLVSAAMSTGRVPL
jgi:hypothetical protein